MKEYEQESVSNELSRGLVSVRHLNSYTGMSSAAQPSYIFLALSSFHRSYFISLFPACINVAVYSTFQ